MYGGVFGTPTPPDKQSLSKMNNFTFLLNCHHSLLPIYLHICTHWWMSASQKKTKGSGVTGQYLEKTHTHTHSHSHTPQREPFVPIREAPWRLRHYHVQPIILF